jgi:hypothetical protein
MSLRKLLLPCCIALLGCVTPAEREAEFKIRMLQLELKTIELRQKIQKMDIVICSDQRDHVKHCRGLCPTAKEQRRRKEAAEATASLKELKKKPKSGVWKK